MTDDGWAGVRDRVLALRRAAGADEVFASLAHGFELEPPLTEPELHAAEGFLGVELPSEYRGFLRAVGAGGAGPGYGVFPLRRCTEGWRWEAEATHHTDTSRLRESFTPYHIGGAEIEPVRLRPPQQYDFEYRDEYEAARQEWLRVLWHPDRTAGAVCLCDLGCLQKYWLVVSGDERGMMWRDHRADGLDLAPLFDEHGNRMTFGRWYLAWLQHAAERAGSD